MDLYIISYIWQCCQSQGIVSGRVTPYNIGMEKEPLEVSANPADTLRKPEIVAPADYVSVYHGTKAESLPFIAQYGLLPMATGRYRHGRADKVLDDNRPAAVAGLGLSRESVFAEPSKLNRQFGDETNLELKVDPEQCYVVNSELVTEVQLAQERGHDESAAAKAEAYWESLVRLDTFLASYHQQPAYSEADIQAEAEDPEEADSMRRTYALGWHRNEGAAENLPEVISFPEVLVPENIPPEHIRIDE
jgi:hypothetical protein